MNENDTFEEAKRKLEKAIRKAAHELDTMKDAWFLTYNPNDFLIRAREHEIGDVYTGSN